MSTNFDIVAAVIQFNHEILGLKPRSVARLPKYEHDHLVMCLTEETDELSFAETPVAQVDAIIDAMYFAIGGLYKLGLSRAMIVDAFEAVHNANMRKAKGKLAKRDTGAADATKPADWVGPEAEIARILGVEK